MLPPFVALLMSMLFRTQGAQSDQGQTLPLHELLLVSSALHMVHPLRGAHLQLAGDTVDEKEPAIVIAIADCEEKVCESHKGPQALHALVVRMVASCDAATRRLLFSSTSASNMMFGNMTT